MALDPVTGEVRAMVGGRDFERKPLQSGHAGAATAGIGLQAVRLCRGARGGLHAGHAHPGLNEPIMTLQGAWLPDDEHSTATR